MTNPFNEITERLDKLTGQLNRPAEQQPDWLDIEGACKLLNLSKSAVYKRTMNRELPFYKFGKKLMFRYSELTAFITGHKAEKDSLPGVKIEK